MSAQDLGSDEFWQWAGPYCASAAPPVPRDRTSLFCPSCRSSTTTLCFVWQHPHFGLLLETTSRQSRRVQAGLVWPSTTKAARDAMSLPGWETDRQVLPLTPGVVVTVSCPRGHVYGVDLDKLRVHALAGTRQVPPEVAEEPHAPEASCAHRHAFLVLPI